MRDPDFTLAAGPTAATAQTLAALGSPITYHYDPVFLDAFRRTEAKVGQLFRTKNEIILMQGEAILGLEAAARSLVRPGLPVLNLVSGVFGKGMGYWLKNFGADLHELEVPYDQSVEPAAVEQYLEEHPEIELLSVCHSETPSGTFNDCARIGPMARSRGVLTLVDCVSSVCGMPFDADGWQLDLCVAGPQKCLGGPPGMSLMAVSERAWTAIEANPAAPRGSFLSLLDWRAQWHGQGRFPYTPSVCDIHGVEAACDQVLAEGLDAAIARHATAAAACRAGITAMGLRLWPKSADITADCVTAVAVPDGLDDVTVRSHVREHYGVMLSGGQGAGNLMRIGHMGPTANGLNPVVGLMALGQSLADLGVNVRIGAGVEAALDLLSSRAHAAPDGGTGDALLPVDSWRLTSLLSEEERPTASALQAADMAIPAINDEMAARVEFGVNLNNREPLIAPGYSLPDLLDLGAAAEQLGFDSIWVGDSLFSKPRFEPLNLLSALSQRTSTVRLGTACLVTSTRNPLYLALEWATLDHLCGGRSILGAGMGNPEAGVRREFEALGLDFRERASIFDEGLAVLRSLWTSGSVTHHGKHYTFDDVSFYSGTEMAPLRPRQTPPPIWVVSNIRLTGDLPPEVARSRMESACRRVVEHGDGWMTCCRAQHPEEVVEQVTQLRKAADDLGVDFSRFVVSYQVTMNIGDSTDAARSAFGQYISSYYPELSKSVDLSNWGPVGTPDTILDWFRQFHDAGVDHFICRFGDLNQFSQVERFATQVLAVLRADEQD